MSGGEWLESIVREAHGFGEQRTSCAAGDDVGEVAALRRVAFVASRLGRGLSHDLDRALDALNAANGGRGWRTLVRVVGVYGGVAKVVVPAWGDAEVLVRRAGVVDEAADRAAVGEPIPSTIAARLSAGQRLHARVDLGARAAEELGFHQWEDR